MAASAAAAATRDPMVRDICAVRYPKFKESKPGFRSIVVVDAAGAMWWCPRLAGSQSTGRRGAARARLRRRRAGPRRVRARGADGVAGSRAELPAGDRRVVRPRADRRAGSAPAHAPEPAGDRRLDGRAAQLRALQRAARARCPRLHRPPLRRRHLEGVRVRLAGPGRDRVAAVPAGRDGRVHRRQRGLPAARHERPQGPLLRRELGRGVREPGAADDHRLPRAPREGPRLLDHRAGAARRAAPRSAASSTRRPTWPPSRGGARSA
jgi:hypothetical protein